jgi:hypothetical protein
MNEGTPVFVCPAIVAEEWALTLPAPLLRLALWMIYSGHTDAEHALPRQERHRIAMGLGIGIEWAREIRAKAVRMGLVLEARDSAGIVTGDFVNLRWPGHRAAP